MKHIATMALMLTLGAASVYAQQHPVNMRFSGSGGPSPIDLKQPNTVNFEEHVAGNGSLGPFTYRDLRAASIPPQSIGACPGPFLPAAFGGGIFRFEDGSLLTFSIKPKEGGDCIDMVQKVARCTLTLEITGGTGRFQNASGVLTYTETAALLAVADFSTVPPTVFMTTETGEITGAISVPAGQEGLPGAARSGGYTNETHNDSVTTSAVENSAGNSVRCRVLSHGSGASPDAHNSADRHGKCCLVYRRHI